MLHALLRQASLGRVQWPEPLLLACDRLGAVEERVNAAMVGTDVASPYTAGDPTFAATAFLKVGSDATLPHSLIAPSPQGWMFPNSPLPTPQSQLPLLSPRASPPRHRCVSTQSAHPHPHVHSHPHSHSRRVSPLPQALQHLSSNEGRPPLKIRIPERTSTPLRVDPNNSPVIHTHSVPLPDQTPEGAHVQADQPLSSPTPQLAGQGIPHTRVAGLHKLQSPARALQDAIISTT